MVASKLGCWSGGGEESGVVASSAASGSDSGLFVGLDSNCIFVSSAREGVAFLSRAAFFMFQGEAGKVAFYAIAALFVSSAVQNAKKLNFSPVLVRVFLKRVCAKLLGCFRRALSEQNFVSAGLATCAI